MALEFLTGKTLPFVNAEELGAEIRHIICCSAFPGFQSRPGDRGAPSRPGRSLSIRLIGFRSHPYL